MHPSVGSPARARFALATLLIAATATLGYASTASQRSPAPRAPRTQAGVGLSATLDREAVLRGGDGRVGVELVITGEPIAQDAPHRVPTDLVIVLDTSGSMQGSKLASAKRAILEATGRLGREDRFALIGYANAAQTLIELAPAGPGARGDWRTHVGAIEASGGTNMAAGIDCALATLSRQAERNGRTARILLISDGHANVGDSSPEGLSARARRASIAELTLSTIGVGLDYNERLMTQIADAGTGNYYFLEQGSELAALFDREFRAARATLATGLEVEVAPARGVSVIEAAGYPLERRGERTVFRPGALFAGQERRVWLTLALSEGERGGPGAASPLGEVALHFTRDGHREHLSLGGLPEVAWVEDPDAYTASFAPSAWGRRVATEEYGQLQAEIAEDVRSGDKARALEKVDAYIARNRTLNEALAVERVDEQITRAQALRDELDQTFASAPMRSRLGKTLSEQALDARRAGQKMAE